ncbi:MAG: hypothetical protein J6T84_01265 [Spirochaetaceae bacterium]|nr:hypothetical protein [Spirochaetaceae bacterium]
MKFNESGFRKISKILMILCILLGCGSLFLFIPQMREYIINHAETFLGRQLDYNYLHKKIIIEEVYLLIWDLFFITAFACLTICKYPVFYKSDKSILNIRENIKHIVSSKKLGISIFFAFTILIGLRFFYISQKKSMHLDECLSISICNKNEYGFWGKSYELFHAYTGKELKDISLWDNSSIVDSLRDIFILHFDTRDPPHTNFYYTLLRLWFTGVKTSDLKYIFWRGCLLNILFFSISFLFMTLLIRRFTDNVLLIFLTLITAFLNPASLSLTVFLRENELQQTFIIILTYYVICCLQTKEKNELIETKNNFVIGISILTFSMLAAYFNIILIGLYGLLIIFFCLKKKDYNLLRFFVFMFILAIIIAKILYFKFGNIGEDAPNSVISTVKTNILLTEINSIKSVISGNICFEMYFALILISAVLILLFNRKNFELNIIAVVIVNLTAFLAIIYFAPMKILRYVAPLFTVFSVFFILSKRKYVNYILISLASLILIVSVVPYKGNQSVEHLDDANIAVLKDIQETELPIFVRSSITCFCADFIPYLSDNSKIIFISDFSDIQKNYEEDIPCIFVNQIFGKKVFDYDTETVFLKKQNSYLYHDVYLIDKTGDVL